MRPLRGSWRFAGVVTLLVATLLAGPVVAMDPQNEVHIGDTMEAVESRLGPARGRAQRGDQLWVQYGRGAVTYQEGRVVAMRLATEAAVQQEQERLAEAQRVDRLTQGAQAEQLRKAGELKRERLRQNPYFLSQPATERLRVLRDLARQHPELDLRAELRSTAVAAAREVRRERAEAARLAESERLAAAERAASAEQEHTRVPYRFARPVPRRIVVHPRVDWAHIQRAPVPETNRFPLFFSPDVTLPASSQPLKYEYAPNLHGGRR